MIKNFLTTEKQIQENSHDGKGVVDLYEIWHRSDFESNLDFIDRVVVPPGSTIGFHKHGENEEMYVVLEGQGLMKIEDDEIALGVWGQSKNPIYKLIFTLTLNYIIDNGFIKHWNTYLQIRLRNKRWAINSMVRGSHYTANRKN